MSDLPADEHAAPEPATPPLDDKVRAAAALATLAGALGEVSVSLLRGEAAAQESCRLQCKGVAGAVMTGAPEEELAQRYADLRGGHMGRTPWAALNKVIEDGLGEAALERIKRRAAALVAAESSAVRPEATRRRGAPRYSQRFGKPPAC